MGDLKRQVQSPAHASPPPPPPPPPSSSSRSSLILYPCLRCHAPFADVFNLSGVVARRPETKQTSGPSIDRYEHTGRVGVGRRVVCDGVGGGSGGVCGVQVSAGAGGG